MLLVGLRVVHVLPRGGSDFSGQPVARVIEADGVRNLFWTEWICVVVLELTWRSLFKDLN